MPADPTRDGPPGEARTRSDSTDPSDATADATRPESAAGDATGPDRPDPPTGVAVPGYEVERELGRGGMGVVYQARHLRLQRPVALKMVTAPDDRAVVRFLVEAEAAAAVRHPHVVQVFDFGDAGGRPFLAMELLAGGSLADRLRAGPPFAPAGAAAVLGKVARGVGAAHALGIVHRDLKPGNVLLDGTGEPKVADFGLAKRAGGGGLTQTDAVMGTPAYMAPEQARGAKFAGPPADVWALGVILYECLTGRRPYPGDGIEAVLHAVLTADPERPRSVAPGVPRDLELVCLKCLEKEPGDRYPTANELADDLDRFARGEPITVRPAGWLERAYKWARRKPTVAGLYALSAAAVILFAFGTVLAWQWRASEAARRDADGQRAAAEAARDALGVEKGKVEALNGALAAKNDQIDFLNYASGLELAAVAYRSTDVSRANVLLAECPARFRGWEWWYLHRLCNQHLANYDADGPADAMTADGRRLLVRTANETKVVDAGDGRVVFSLTHPRTYNELVALSADGGRLAVEGPDRTVRVFDTATGQPAFTLREAVAWPAVALSPDGRRLAAVDAKDGAVRVWGPDGTPVFRLDLARPARADRVAYSPDGTWLVTHAADARLRVWDAATGRAVADAPAPDGKPLPPQAKLAFLGRGERFAVDPGVSPVRVYDTPTARELCPLADTNKDGFDAFNPSAVMRLVGSPDGRWVATGHQGTSVQIWDAQTGKRVSTTQVFDRSATPYVLRSLEFSPDSTRVVTTDTLATPDVVRNRVRIWDAQTGRLIQQLPADAQASRAWFLPGGDRVLTSHLRGGVYVWSAVPDRWRTTVALPPGAAPADPPLTADGRRIVALDRAGATLLWDVATGDRVTAADELAAVGRVRPPRSEQYRFRAEVRGGVVYVFDPAHRPVALPRAAGGARSVAVSPDGSRVVVVGADGRAGVRAVPSGDELVRFDHPGPLSGAAFTRDGRHVVLKPRAFEEVVFDAATGRRLLTVRDTAQYNGVDLLVPAPDGRRAAVTHQSGIVRVWDTATDRLLLDHLPTPGLAVGFTPDGRRLVVLGYGVQVVDVAPVGAPDGWRP